MQEALEWLVLYLRSSERTKLGWVDSSRLAARIPEGGYIDVHTADYSLKIRMARGVAIVDWKVRSIVFNMFGWILAIIATSGFANFLYGIVTVSAAHVLGAFAVILFVLAMGRIFSLMFRARSETIVKLALARLDDDKRTRSV